jgi:hypothetical protein
MVTATDGWSQMLSHDCLEMLVSPFNTYVIEVPSPKPDQGRVLLLVQICDPCASAECAYEIDGVTVATSIRPNTSSCWPKGRRHQSTTRALFDHHSTWRGPGRATTAVSG